MTDTVMRRKRVLAASVGNFIDFFEFGLYGIFTTAIALNFFPVEGKASLLLTFAGFAVSFVFRPLGAVVFGHFGDRLGRRGALAVTIVGISVATFVIGVLPATGSIGIAAPVVLVIARVAQGFCTGGEFGGATTVMIEGAPDGRRAFYGSWQNATQLFATVASTGIGMILAVSMSGTALNDWGWRIPFLLTLPLGLIGLYLRLRLSEAEEFTRAAEHPERAPLGVVLRQHWRSVLKIIAMIVVGTSVTYLQAGFFPAYLVREAGVPQSLVYAGMLVGSLVGAIGILVCGRLADRIGRQKPFLVAGPIAQGALAIPVYLLAARGDPVSVICGYLLLNLGLAINCGVISCAIAESFPARVRYTGISLGYTVAVSVFGGATPLILTGLVAASGTPMAIPVYVLAASVVSLLGALSYPETGWRGRSAQRPSAVEAAM
ncbi:MFS transporter [Sciscionella sediminilitoris]|uniref:MFS transporter n=1 Tax=Sciscionella sediminilitoris TaxID=1445613 RepID=UPI000690EC16|nr:MFS transporter [Sciscionella sp. SE31]